MCNSCAVPTKEQETTLKAHDGVCQCYMCFPFLDRGERCKGCGHRISRG